ncbi:TPA: hypothetical protein ACN7SH_002526 [Klebsiella pneumoniae]|uniref:hypothetical protein n=1 Tax=Klebsiella TaxID=570 RepID=UPI001159E93A|nr:hypothetical protein [Klebsiella pneumoniae]HDU4017985.1 hypothetical protein [Klebsiella pneumoniae subsp. pneumoniae]MCB3471262.1 hypothetical protein [Klebsiella pneumoniae]MCB3479784.1 hypothetical protein [Klebsiella pneumoniae]MCB3507147.1 hypothetical protein [Klebsiella pneumoniae]MCM5721453.1 hypothetical protein [Klebsiella pneumoniae]
MMDIFNALIYLTTSVSFYSCNILITCREGHKAGDNTIFGTVKAFCRGATGALPGLKNTPYKPLARLP